MRPDPGAALAALASLALCLVATGARAAVDFSDLPPGYWAAADVRSLAASGVIAGFPDGTFRGNRPLTRYELSAILARADAMLSAEAAGTATKAELDALQKELLGLERRVAALELRIGVTGAPAGDGIVPRAAAAPPFLPLAPPLDGETVSRATGAAAVAHLVRRRGAALAATASQTDVAALRPALAALAAELDALAARAGSAP